MKKQDKVIEGLSTCLTAEGVCHCRKCSYKPKHIREDDPFACAKQLRKDAIDLITKMGRVFQTSGKTGRNEKKYL